jgi:hypothetical protein
MGDVAGQEGSGGRHAALQPRPSVPPVPLIGPSEQLRETPYPLLDGLSPTIGWHFRHQGNEGPAFVILRRSAFGSLKVVESFPLTEDGWAKAWKSLAKQNPAAVPKVLETLATRQADASRLSRHSQETDELDAQTLVSLPAVAYLGGYVSSTGIFAGQRYDVRFLEDRLWVLPCRQAEVLAEVPYAQIEDVEIGGPGLVKTGGGFVGGGFGVQGAAEGMAIAAVLNALTTRTSITTILRIQGTGCELFLLHTKATPAQLRIELSRPLAAIRSTQATPPAVTTATGSDPAARLRKLQELRDAGLLTQDEYETRRTEIINSI